MLNEENKWIEIFYYKEGLQVMFLVLTNTLYYSSKNDLVFAFSSYKIEKNGK